MNNVEKMSKVGETVYGSNWQSPLSRALGINDRTIRRYAAGTSNIGSEFSDRLLAAMEHEMSKLKTAIEIIESDKMNGDDISLGTVISIVDSYKYLDRATREHAIDAVNNAIYPETYLSDLHSVAQKFSI